MRHTFFTVTVINRWNNLPRDVVDSLSFKRFTSTLDTFQRDKPVSQTDVENTGWGSLSGVCKKSDWMLITAAQHCTSTKQFCKCSALQGPIISRPSYLSFGCSSVQAEQRLSAKSIFLSGRWNKNPFRRDMGIFKDYPMPCSLSGIITAGGQITSKRPVSTHWKAVWAPALPDASTQGTSVGLTPR